MNSVVVLILFTIASCFAQYIPKYIEIIPDAAPIDYLLTSSRKSLYFKVNGFNETEHYLVPTLSGCKGQFFVSIVYCHQNCNDSSVRNVPSVYNHDFISISSSSPLRTFCNKAHGRCPNIVYYIYIEKITDELELNVQLKKAPTQNDFIVFSENLIATIDIKLNIHINPVKYCLINHDGSGCKVEKPLNNALYSIYYIQYVDHEINLIGNLGSVCGIKKYGVLQGSPMPIGSNNELSFSTDLPVGTKIDVGVLYEVEVEGKIFTGAYRPFDLLIFPKYRHQIRDFSEYKVVFWLGISYLSVGIAWSSYEMFLYFRNNRRSTATQEQQATTI
ncbi:hypothetical protein AKO1_004121 [Acrasis kona]|uniref:Uncharacterized protein n=1 Tax=Acrasis kona TaxID=1008807 RepID=A0AAW2ZAI5_9EUKA